MTLYLEVSTSGMWDQEFSFTGIFLLEWGSSCSDVNWYVWHWTCFIPEDTRVEIQNSRIRKHQKKGPRLVKVLFATPGWWFDPCSVGRNGGKSRWGKSMDLLRQGVSRRGSQLAVSPLPSWQEGKTGEISAPEKLLFLCLSENLKGNTRMPVGSQPNLQCWLLSSFLSMLSVNRYLGKTRDPAAGVGKAPPPRATPSLSLWVQVPLRLLPLHPLLNCLRP